MKLRNKHIKYTEFALMLFVWLVLLITPLLFREDNNKPLWKSIGNQLEILIPLSVLFVINRFYLVRNLLFRRKPMVYMASVLFTIVILAFGSYVYETGFKRKAGPSGRDDREQFRGSEPAPLHNEPPPRPDEPQRRQPKPVPPYANFIIFAVLVAGFDTGLQSGMRWIEADNEKMRLERENVATQLLMLRNQVSPHFFMNTLNNIHALVDFDSSEAKEAIIKLSKMMRYLLYETEAEKTSLKKEIEFLESYINLMRLRFTEKVTISLQFPDSVPEKTIPPFLFTSFIENAFKHGVSYREASFIEIAMLLNDDRLLFTVKNSKAGKEQLNDYAGIGIENTRKRLQLLYGSNYRLDIFDNESTFTINLSIPV
jgi:hypothetical protein